MRIGIDARLVHYQKAGISQYTVQLMQALALLPGDDEFTIFQSVHDKAPIIDRDRFSTRHLITPSHHRLEQYLLPLEIAATRIELLHSPDFIPPLKAGVKSVITIHDLVFMMYPHFLTKASARYYGQIDQAVRRADGIIAVSQATKRDVMSLLGVPEQKVTVIHEAASAAFRPMNKEKAKQQIQGNLGVTGDFLLFVSTIEPRKNLPTLLRAFRQLLDSYDSSVKLVVAGSRGWLFDEVFDLTERLDLTENVLFVGRVSNQELVALYNAAEALVLPSLYEGFGLTPLEAMACGTPVVVSNVSSLPEVVGDAGLTFDPTDAEELTVALSRVLHDSELRTKLQTKGLKRAATFSWEKAARQTLELYHQLA